MDVFEYYLPCPHFYLCEFDEYIEKSGWRKHLKEEYLSLERARHIKKRKTKHKYCGFYIGNALTSFNFDREVVIVLCPNGRYYYVYDDKITWNVITNSSSPVKIDPSKFSEEDLKTIFKEYINSKEKLQW